MQTHRLVQRYNIRFAAILFAVAFATAGPPAYADWIFDSGSDGRDGPFDPPTSVPAGTVIEGTDGAWLATVPLPASGVFKFTSVNVLAGWTIKFAHNAANTPVYILASDSVFIGGTVDLTGEPGDFRDGPGARIGGRGGPGGWSGGAGGIEAVAMMSSVGLGPGGGTAFHGNYHFGYGGSMRGYTSPDLLTLNGGSGGRGGGMDVDAVSFTIKGAGGGGGGGAILVASSLSITVDGLITARGGEGGGGIDRNGDPYIYGGSGSGGAIRLIANTMLGGGEIKASGGSPAPGTYGGQYHQYLVGKSGRIRLEAYNLFDPFGLPLKCNPLPSVARIAFDALPQEPVPHVAITEVDGQSLSVPTNGSWFVAGDVTITPATEDMVDVPVVVQAENIPPGTQVTLRLAPRSGQHATHVGALAGTPQSSSAVFTATLKAAQTTVLQAYTEQHPPVSY